MTDTLTNDAYFQEEINRIQNNRAYVTEEELRNYLELVIEKNLTTCDLIDLGDDVYEFRIPISDKKVLSRFLTTNQPSGEENEIAFNKFRRTLDDTDRILLTFSQKKAYDDRSLIFMNIYHPMIQACLKYFTSHEDKANRSFCYAIKGNHTLISGSIFYMGVYKYITSRMVQGVEKKSETLYPFVFDLKKQEMESNQDVIDQLFSLSQIGGMEYNPSENEYNSQIVDEMRLLFTESSSFERKSRLSELQRQAESDRLHSEIQTTEFYNIRINAVKKRLKEREDILEYFTHDSPERQNLERLIKMDRGLLESHRRELQEKLDIINESKKIVVECEPSSIALIKVR